MRVTTTPAPSVFSKSPYIRRISQLTADQLSCIDRYLQILLQQNADNIRKTHLFHHRYENIYLESSDNPDLACLISECLKNCAEILELNAGELSMSYWFNLMQPGHVTTLHTHDDIDELLSGVVYLTVPENSGDLIIQDCGEEIVLKPQMGHYIFFDPATAHSVSENRSSRHRLSIGMNFGLKKNKC